MAIVVPIDADVSGLTRKLGMATSTLGGFGKMAGYVAGAAALGGLIATVKIGVDEFMQAEKVTAQTNAVLKSTGSVANVTKGQIDQLGTSIMRKSGMDDEAVKSAENLLLTFTKVRNETGKGNDVFSQATKITADLSVAFGKDLNGSAIVVGKALNDPVKGLGALSRVGIQFSEDQKKVIKGLVESGDTMKAQKMILKELETQVGGSAAAYGETLSGKLNIAKETFRNLAGDLVSAFMPAIANAASALGRFVSNLSSREGFKAKLNFVFETAEQVVSRFYQWWTQPSMKTVRSPTSGVHVEFTPPGSQQVTNWIQQIDAAVKAKLGNWAQNAGYSLMDSLFNGAKRGASDKTGGLVKYVLMWMNPAMLGAQAEEDGAFLMRKFWTGIQNWLKSHPGVATKAIKDWLTSAGNALTGAAGDVWNSVTSGLNNAVGRSGRLLHTATIAKIITADMKAAIQSARAGLAGAASGLAGMLNQIVSVRGTNPAADLAAARDLEDRRLKLQEDSLTTALKTAVDSGEGVNQAQLDLDQFYFDKKSTLRQREVDDESKKNQSAIDDLAARFNKGLIDATAFNAGLDALIGGEAGTSLGEAFSLNFTNAIQSLKNAALDIAGIAGASNPLGPDVGASGGPVASAALAAYNDALSKWQDRQNTLAQKVKDLRDKANDDNSPGGKTITQAEKAAIDKAIRARDGHAETRPVKKDYGLAMGGLLTGPRYIAGESGNEAVIPLGSPTAVQMMRKAFGDSVNSGGDTVYNISVNAGMGADGTDIGRQIVEAIKVFERRNGPVFAGA
jgi:hypothetical protein